MIAALGSAFRRFRCSVRVWERCASSTRTRIFSDWFSSGNSSKWIFSSNRTRLSVTGSSCGTGAHHQPGPESSRIGSALGITQNGYSLRTGHAFRLLALRVGPVRIINQDQNLLGLVQLWELLKMDILFEPDTPFGYWLFVARLLLLPEDAHGYAVGPVALRHVLVFL